MELLDRYLQAVRFWLPRSQQDDIIAELSEDIRSEIEEQEAALGRPLQQAEIESILKKHGRPIVVANRYLPQQNLIGPVLFPAYQFVLKMVALFYLLPWSLTWVALMAFDPQYRLTHSVERAWAPLWSVALTLFAVITIVFAVLERMQSRSGFLDNWDPGKLPPFRNLKQIPRSGSVIEVVANGVFLVWWMSSMGSLTIFEHSGVRIVLEPAWRIYFWAFVLIAFGNIALAAVNLMRPYWTAVRAGIRFAMNCVSAIAFCWLCRAHPLAEIIAPNLSLTRAAEITNAINMQMAKAFPFAVMACVLIIMLADGFRLYRLRTGRTTLLQSPA
jgi:hypothetical protein